jgi:hypothetical protein
MARISDQEMSSMLVRMGQPRSPETAAAERGRNVRALVDEVRRLRDMIDRIYEHVPQRDDELDAEVLEIRQERRARAVADKEGRS